MCTSCWKILAPFWDRNAFALSATKIRTCVVHLSCIRAHSSSNFFFCVVDWRSQWRESPLAWVGAGVWRPDCKYCWWRHDFIRSHCLPGNIYGECIIVCPLHSLESLWFDNHLLHFNVFVAGRIFKRGVLCLLHRQITTALARQCR